MLSLRDLSIDYPGFSSRYTLQVPRGDLCALVGPSGGGKTTLLSAIAGFEPLGGGELRFDGKDLTGLEPSRRPVSVLFQEFNLFPHLTVTRNVGLGIRPDLRLDESDRVRIEEALTSVGLASMGERSPATLSGGERQRVGLARALVMRRPVLLLDEAFGSLDPGLRRGMLRLVDALRRDHGLTVVMSIHTPGDIVGLADSIAFVQDGEVLVHDTPLRVLSDARPEIARFLGKGP